MYSIKSIVQNKKRSRQPKKRATLPKFAERRYVGFLTLRAKALQEAVLTAIGQSFEPEARLLADKLSGVRRDANDTDYFVKKAGVGNRILSGLRFYFGDSADKLEIDTIGHEVLGHVKRQAKKVLGISSDSITSQHNIEYWRRENVALIKRMTDEQLSKITAILDKTSTDTVDSVASSLLQEFEITTGRARKIAIDQTLKFNAQLTKEIHKQAGIEEYYWADGEDDAVRDTHRKLGDASRDGKRFRYDDPPVSEKNGDRNNPGEGVLCRCQAIPYVPEYE